jgi:hypothetical protein
MAKIDSVMVLPCSLMNVESPYAGSHVFMAALDLEQVRYRGC